MKKYPSILLVVATLGFTFAFNGVLHGNGQQFFIPAKGKVVDLVYFGRIRDKSTGRLIRTRAFFTVFDNATGLSFPFMNDSVAHYRSPDIGASVKELGGVKVDPKNLEIQLMVSGYKDVRLTTMPRAKRGAVELNFALEPAGTASPQALSSGTAEESKAAPLPDQWPLAQPLAYGSVGLFMVAATVRTLGRRRSTTD